MAVYPVDVRRVPKLRVASIRRVVSTPNEIAGLFEELWSHMPGMEQIRGSAMALYYHTENVERDIDMEVAVVVADEFEQVEGLTVRELPEIEMACTVYHGPFDAEPMGEAYNAVIEWINNNGYHFVAPTREIYINPPMPGVDPKDYVTEIQLPIEKL
jgi:effector-binding domain-containing protein